MKEKQAARGKQRGVLTPAEKAKFNEAAALEELKCWTGYRRKPGSVPGQKGSCVKEEEKKGPCPKTGEPECHCEEKKSKAVDKIPKELDAAVKMHAKQAKTLRNERRARFKSLLGSL